MQFLRIVRSKLTHLVLFAHVRQRPDHERRSSSGALWNRPFRPALALVLEAAALALDRDDEGVV